jgi:hypothetical protein
LRQQALLNQTTIERRRSRRVTDLGDAPILLHRLGGEVTRVGGVKCVLERRQCDGFRLLLFTRRSRPLQRLFNERLVRFLYLFLKVAVEHAHSDATVLQVLDPLAVHGWIGVFDADPDLLDPRQDNSLRAAQLRMSARTGCARLQGCEQNGAVEFPVAILALQQRILGVVAVAQLAPVCGIYRSIGSPKNRPHQRARLAVRT